MLTESCVIFFGRPEPFKALFCEVIYRPVEREREKGEQGMQQNSGRPRPCTIQFRFAKQTFFRNKPSSKQTFTFVAPEEGLFCKPKYRAIFCFIHFFALRISSSVSSFL